MSALHHHPCHLRLIQHAQALSNQQLSDLFRADPQRFERFTRSSGPLLLDFSKQPVTTRTLDLWGELVAASGLADGIEQLYAGAPLNHSERRAALHVALRAPDLEWHADGVPVSNELRAVQAQLAAFADAIRDGRQCAPTGRYQSVIHIGIGGSDLGPRLVVDALMSGEQPLQVHFVANIDAHELHSVMQLCDPQRTLVVVVSKSFGTVETLRNAELVRSWMEAGGGVVAEQFVAVTAALDKAGAFGIPAQRCFAMWDWVGGRFSVWSAVGLGVRLALGNDLFDRLCAGARNMDQHFRTAPWHDNLPILMALLAVWNGCYLGCESHALLPYDQRLAWFPAYLQQLEMESLGKAVAIDGEPLQLPTGAVVWGQVGVIGQHSFHQLLHQGMRRVSLDFIVAARAEHDTVAHHRLLVANCLAQAEALMQGKSAATAHAEMLADGCSAARADELAPHRAFPGNRGSTTLVLDRLNAETLGALMALYEHKVFVLGWLMGINPFDQWGVELGKQLAGRIETELAAGVVANEHDGSTAGLMAHLLRVGQQSL